MFGGLLHAENSAEDGDDYKLNHCEGRYSDQPTSQNNLRRVNLKQVLKVHSNLQCALGRVLRIDDVVNVASTILWY
jgi:hypothetical protein